MRIAYICNEFPPLVYGGLGVYVDQISRELTSLGPKVTVFTLGDEGQSGQGLSRHEDVGGVEVYREIPVPLRDGLEIFLSGETLAWGEGLGLLLDLLSYNHLSAARILDSGPLDLCVAHDWLALPAGMAVKRRGLPMIYHVHGLEIGRSSHPNLQLAALEKRGAEVADAVITVSQAMRQEMARLGVDEKKVSVCYHGVDASFYDPAKVDPKAVGNLRKKYGLGEIDQLVLFLGRLEPVKGVMQLIEAMSMVAQKYPRARLLLVGRGSLEEKVCQELKRRDIGTLITDFLAPEEKRDHYALADLCAFPSIYEPFGIVALEAAAMGVAAVVGASGTSGLREIVENPAAPRPTGVHVDGRSPEDIAWGVELALEDPVRLKVWGQNARARALERFTWGKAAEETLEIYRRVAPS
jgi:glycosyltransferase involved in cell wall biosynthesis